MSYLNGLSLSFVVTGTPSVKEISGAKEYMAEVQIKHDKERYNNASFFSRLRTPLPVKLKAENISSHDAKALLGRVRTGVYQKVKVHAAFSAVALATVAVVAGTWIGRSSETAAPYMPSVDNIYASVMAPSNGLNNTLMRGAAYVTMLIGAKKCLTITTKATYSYFFPSTGGPGLCSRLYGRVKAVGRGVKNAAVGIKNGVVGGVKGTSGFISNNKVIIGLVAAHAIYSGVQALLATEAPAPAAAGAVS